MNDEELEPLKQTVSSSSWVENRLTLVPATVCTAKKPVPCGVTGPEMVQETKKEQHILLKWILTEIISERCFIHFVIK